MKRVTVVGVMVLLVVGAFGVVAGGEHDGRPSNKRSEGKVSSEQVEQMAREFSDKWFAILRIEDPEPVGRIRPLIANDVISIYSDGSMHQGKKEFLAGVKKTQDGLKSNFIEANYEYEITSTKVFNDTAIVLGVLEFSGALKDNNKPIWIKTWRIMVFRKQGRQWQLTHQQSTKVNMRANRTEEPDEIVGVWTWFNNNTVRLNALGRINNNNKNTWKCTDPEKRVYTLTWDNGSIDTLTLSKDGKWLKGYNQFGIAVSGRRKD